MVPSGANYGAMLPASESALNCTEGQTGMRTQFDVLEMCENTY